MAEAHNTMSTLQTSRVGPVSVGNTRKIVVIVDIVHTVSVGNLDVDSTILETLWASILDCTDAWFSYGS